MEPNDELPLSAVAARLGLTQRRVHQLIKTGQLPAERHATPFGMVYLMVRRNDLERLAQQRLDRSEGRVDRVWSGPRPRPPVEA